MTDPNTPADNGTGGQQAEVVEPATEPKESDDISSPTKLIRIASMVRMMLDEVRHAPLDEAGRKLLREVHQRAVAELSEGLSEELRGELASFLVPFDSDPQSESELRIAQAQLVGWLEGLFHGIQASLFTQQASAAQQLEHIARRNVLTSGTPADDGENPGAGAYL